MWGNNNIKPDSWFPVELSCVSRHCGRNLFLTPCPSYYPEACPEPSQATLEIQSQSLRTEMVGHLHRWLQVNTSSTRSFLPEPSDGHPGSTGLLCLDPSLIISDSWEAESVTVSPKEVESFPAKGCFCVLLWLSFSLSIIFFLTKL